MKKYSQFPLLLLYRSVSLWLKGYVHFTKDDNGKIVKAKEEDFVIFRKVVVAQQDMQNTEPAAILKIFFKFKNFSLKVNRILSLIPVPFIIAQPGFRSKTWLYGRQSGTFQGLYEWENIETAQKYQHSLPLKLMKKRAIAETLVFDIISNKRNLTID